MKYTKTNDVINHGQMVHEKRHTIKIATENLQNLLIEVAKKSVTSKADHLFSSSIR